MYLRICRMCGLPCKIENRDGKYCNDCAAVLEGIRVCKIKLNSYSRSTIFYQEKKIALEKKKSEIEKDATTRNL